MPNRKAARCGIQVRSAQLYGRRDAESVAERTRLPPAGTGRAGTLLATQCVVTPRLLWRTDCISPRNAGPDKGTPMTKTSTTFIGRRLLLAGAAGALAAPTLHSASAQAVPIKIGVLHSLSGTMAISETALRDTALMMVEAQNAAGGIMGRRLEAVVVDPASNWPLFAEKASSTLRAHFHP